jgi:hypothetical protein
VATRNFSVGETDKRAMNNPEFCHERSPLYQEAREMYRLLLELARSNTGWMDQALRRHARRLLDHAAAAGDPPSPSMELQSLRFAKLCALKISAAVEAGLLEGQLTKQAYALARRQLARLLDELGQAHPCGESLPKPPSQETAQSPVADHAEGAYPQPVAGHEEPLTLLANVAPAGTS